MIPQQLQPWSLGTHTLGKSQAEGHLPQCRARWTPGSPTGHGAKVGSAWDWTAWGWSGPLGISRGPFARPSSERGQPRRPSSGLHLWPRDGNRGGCGSGMGSPLSRDHRAGLSALSTTCEELREPSRAPGPPHAPGQGDTVQAGQGKPSLGPREAPLGAGPIGSRLRVRPTDLKPRLPCL